MEDKVNNVAFRDNLQEVAINGYSKDLTSFVFNGLKINSLEEVLELFLITSATYVLNQLISSQTEIAMDENGNPNIPDSYKSSEQWPIIMGQRNLVSARLKLIRQTPNPSQS